jgi:membrane associated rhomboid family serine protease
MRDDLQIPPGVRREPMINAPWTLVVLVVVLVGAHGARLLAGVPAERFALTADDLDQGRLWPLVTHLFVHSGWAHVAMNSAFSLAFGAPVARFLGADWRGALAFFVFFLTCGALAALSYAGVMGLTPGHDPSSGAWALVGASGAASGLLGAAARLIEGRGRLGPIAGRRVVGMTLAWVAINAGLGLSGLTPGAAGAPVAWQAHIFGFAAGLLLIGPATWIARGLKRGHE